MVESVHMGRGGTNYNYNPVSKVIDRGKNELYNPDHGKSDRIEGPKKEINNGSI